MAVVTREDPRTLRVCHFNKGTDITSRKFDAKILSVKLNREVSKSNRLENPLERSLVKYPPSRHW